MIKCIMCVIVSLTAGIGIGANSVYQMLMRKDDKI